MKRTKRKPGYLGPAFYEWLTFLEAAEAAVYKGVTPKKPLAVGINDAAFGIREEDQDRVNMELLFASADLAGLVRSSVKYRMSYNTISLLHEHYKHEIEYIRDNRPIHLPHDSCTIVFGVDDGDDTYDTYIVNIHETTPNDDYPQLDCGMEDTFICANIVGYRPTGLDVIENAGTMRLSQIPVEIHMQKGRLVNDTKTLWACANGALTDSDAAEHTLGFVYGSIMTWLSSLQLAAVLRSKTLGLPPNHTSFKPKKPRKRKQLPNFEHFVIELPVDQMQSDPQGRTCNQPHKRLHQVRGFWRHYKSGKTVWVKPHWRGDEKLGVVRNDYELTLNRNSG